MIEPLKQKLTADLINRAKPGTEPNEKGVIPDVVIRDTEVPGLFLRVTPNGAKSLLVRYRLGKGRGAPVKQPKLPIEHFTPQSLAQAREIARDWRAKGVDGIDVNKLRRAEAEAPTVALLCTDYMAKHGSEKRSASEDQRRIDKQLPKRLLRLRVKDVSSDDIHALHRSFRDRPYEGNRLLALLSKMFSLAVQWKWCSENPAASVAKFPEEQRERFLHAAELARLDTALSDYVVARGDGEAKDGADAIRLLLLTGCRVGELMAATWDQFDLDAGVWTKPSSHTKQKKVHKVALSAPAIEVLEGIRARREFQGRFVFPGRHGGHRKSVKKAWADIRVRAGIEDVRLHDLRHTAASVMLSAGVPLDIVGRVLGHTQAQTTLRYAHLSDEAGKAATDALSKVIAFGKKEA